MAPQSPQGWQRQRKWQAREWVRLVFQSMKLYTQTNIIKHLAMAVGSSNEEDDNDSDDEARSGSEVDLSRHDDDDVGTGDAKIDRAPSDVVWKG